MLLSVVIALSRSQSKKYRKFNFSPLRAISAINIAIARFGRLIDKKRTIKKRRTKMIPKMK